MFKKTKVCKGLMLALGGSLALSVLPALAQQATTTLDRVEITGSSIKRLAAEQALPVTVLKADDLAKAGVTNAEQAMSFIAANQSGTVTAGSVGASNGGAAYADLRSLGTGRTLVLVNGKRMVNNPYSSVGVDLNALPFGAIDRIEVLTDGASAIYGTDAIAGVINFITRKDYTGVGLVADASLPTTSGDGRTYNLGITGGIGNLSEQGWNVFGGVSYRKQDALASTDRDYAKTAYIPSQGVNKTSGTTFPGTYYQGTLAATNPALPNCAPPFSIAVNGACRFDYVPFIAIVPEQEQLSLIAKGSYAINKDNTISLEYIQANNKLNTTISPTPLTGLSMTPANPNYPGAGSTPAYPGAGFDPTQPISLSWRQTDLKGRASEFTNDTNRLMAQWEGQYRGWDYSATLFRSKADVIQNFTGGYVNSSMVRNGLTAGGTSTVPWLNPFGDQSAAGEAYLQSALILGQVQKATGTLDDFTAQASGEIAKLPAGSMMLAVGVEFLHDTAAYTNNFTLIRQAASSGLELAEDSNGSRRDSSIMAELNIPVVKDLDVNLAIRYDNYSDFGSTTNPKASFRWQPNQMLLFRGSYNKGFRAPTLQDAYAPNSITYTGNPYDDPLLCPNGVVNSAAGGVASRDCGMQFQMMQGGNAALKPETSNAWTLGFAVQPIASTTVGLDYWSYKIQHSIGQIGEDVIFGDPVKYAANFIRCGTLSAADQTALSAVCGNGASPNTLAYITNTTFNLGNYNTDGIDLTATWVGEATQYGKFSAGMKATYVMSAQSQNIDGSYSNVIDQFSSTNIVHRYKQVLNFGWQYGAWATQLVNRYSNSYQDENPDVNGNTHVVAGTNVWDLAVTWSGVKGLALTAGLTNMFNQTPPFSNQGSTFQVGYDPRYASPIGRAFLLRGTYQF